MFGLLWVRSYIRVVHPVGPRVTAPFASPPWGHPLLPRLVFPPPPCRLSRLWLVTTGPDTAPDIAYHTFNIPLSCSDSSLNALRWQWWKPVFVSPSSPPPYHKRHSPYVSDNRQQLIRTLQSYTKETVSLVRDVKILDWQWYMPAVCVLCVHQISESHTSHCCLDLDSSSGAENSQWIILPGCAPHLPAAPAFTQHPGGVNLHSFRFTTPTWVWNVQKRCFQV